MEALQYTLVDAVQIRFPDLTEFAQKKVKLFKKPDELEMIFQKILTAPDARTARWLLESIPGQ